MAIADTDHVPLVHHDERERPLESWKESTEGLFETELGPVLLSLPGEVLDEDLRVGDVIEFDLRGEIHGVREVAVVGQRQRTIADLTEDGLGVSPLGRPGGGVPRVPDRQRSLECGEDFLVEYLGNQSQFLEHGRGFAIRCADAGALLSAVLEGEQAEVREVACAFPR